MNRESTFLGTVEDVSGTTIRVQLSEETISGLSFIEGQSYRVGQVGGFVRIPLGFVNLYGVISQVGASSVPERLAAEHQHGNRWMTVQVVGEGQRNIGFDRGISQYPTIGDEAHLVTERDLRAIYGRPADLRFVQVGRLASADSIPALIDIDKLVTRHSAVLGTTGSGKSTTVAGILAALSDSAHYPSARILVIDIHGEYGRALSDRAAIFRISRTASHERQLYIPYWAMTFDELLTVTLGSIHNDGDRGAVIDRIMRLKLQSIERVPRPGITRESVTVDSPVPFSIHRLWFELYCEMRATHYERRGEAQSATTRAFELDGDGNPVQAGDMMEAIPPRFKPVKDVAGDSEKIRWSQSSLGVGPQVDGLGSRLRDPRFDFLFRPGPYLPSPEGEVEKDLDGLLASWLGDDKPISILDLSGVPPSIQSEVVGALLRIVYEALFWARDIPEGGRERPLLLVLEEAHAYLTAEQGAASAAVKRVAKEGRKYGIGIMLVSQRPSEIESTILSQCGTLFALRLTNSGDRGIVRSVASDNLEGLFETLPVLRTGEAIIVGEAVNLPIRTLIDRPGPNRRPHSADPKVIVPGNEEDGYDSPGGWNQKRDPADYAEAVELWRSQNPRSKNVVAEETSGEGGK